MWFFSLVSAALSDRLRKAWFSPLFRLPFLIPLLLLLYGVPGGTRHALSLDVTAALSTISGELSRSVRASSVSLALLGCALRMSLFLSVGFAVRDSVTRAAAKVAAATGHGFGLSNGGGRM